MSDLRHQLTASVEAELAAFDLVREAKFLACAPRHIIQANREWIEEAREFLNDALAKAEKEAA